MRMVLAHAATSGGSFFHRLPGILHEHLWAFAAPRARWPKARRSSGSAIAAEAFMSNAAR